MSKCPNRIFTWSVTLPMLLLAVGCSADSGEASLDFEGAEPTVESMAHRLNTSRYLRFGGASLNSKDTVMTLPLIRYLAGELSDSELDAAFARSGISTPFSISCAESANLLFYAQVYGRLDTNATDLKYASYASLSGVAKGGYEIAGPIDLCAGLSCSGDAYFKGLREGDRITWQRVNPDPTDVVNNAENGVYLGIDASTGEHRAFVYGLGMVQLEGLVASGYEPVPRGRVWRACHAGHGLASCND